MDTPLAGERIAEEKAFAKRYVETLAARPVEYPADYAPPLETRSRKVPVLQTPIAAPPDVSVEDSAAQDATVSVTVKSLKPPLQIPITISLSDSVADLKAAVAAASPDAPVPDLQRLLLKGKALADSKLLKEYDISAGAVINLLAKAAPPAPAPSQSAAALATPPPTKRGHMSTPSLTITTSDCMEVDAQFASDVSPEPPSPVSGANFHATLANPKFWHKVHALVQDEFNTEAEADTVFDAFLMSIKSRLSASEAAKIRDEVGISGMGGGV